MSKPPSFWSLFDKPEEPDASSGPSFFSLFDKEAPAGEAPGADQPPPEPPPCAVRFDPRCFYWTLRNLPLKEATKHMFVCGMPGSGKTTLVRLLLQSIARRFRPDFPGRPEQLIVFDPKGDMLPLLAGMKLHPDFLENFWLLNPADTRGAAWNIAEATADPLTARQFATLLVPEEPHSKAPYFPDAARELVVACLLALHEKRGTRWTFRDLLCSLDSVARIKAVTQSTPAAARVAARIIEDDLHASSVLSTLGARLGRFEQVAALWTKSQRKFSIPEFFARPGVLVLSNDPKLRDSIWPMNALLLKALTDEVLRQPETQQPRFWFVLDEFRAMRQVPCVHDLLNRGRSKGAAVLLGTQSIEGIVEIYGEHAANDLLSQCAYKTFLRAGGPATGEWAERYFHKVRSYEATVSESCGTKERSVSVQRALQERSLFLSATFQDLPLPEPGGPIVAISDVPCLHQVRISTRSFDELLYWCRDPLDEVPGLDPRTNPADQRLEPWSEAEVAEHCAAPPPAARNDSSATTGDAPGASGKPPPRRDRSSRTQGGEP